MPNTSLAKPGRKEKENRAYKYKLKIPNQLYPSMKKK